MSDDRISLADIGLARVGASPLEDAPRIDSRIGRAIPTSAWPDPFCRHQNLAAIEEVVPAKR